MFSYIDTDGLRTLKQLISDMDSLDVRVLLAGCPSHVGRLIEPTTTTIDAANRTHQLLYISVPDAIEHALLQQLARFLSPSSTPFC